SLVGAMSVGSEGALLAGRYRLTRLLGRGSTADVHAAFDVALQANVALKRFRAQSPEGLRGLKAEFRALTEIHHAGLIELFDLVVTDETAFFTMELFEGRTFVDSLRSASALEVARTAAQVADAIAALHVRGVLHRDLKPSNVLVSPGGHVRVVDFGLSVVKGPLVGTLATMAPELFEGAAPGPAADWYGLGVLLYEALTGSVPVAGDTVAEVVLRKRMRRFRRPREASPSVPPDLDEVVWALLDPDPGARATHAAIAGLSRHAGATPDVRSTTAGARTLFGRASELDHLLAAWRRAASGEPTALLVEGSSGIGKTALVREFLAERCSESIVLRGAARPQELVPLRAIDAVVDQLVAQIEALPDPRRPSLVEREPALEALEARRHAQASLASVFRALSGQAPLVVWIDDLQWADYESLLFLRTTLNAGPGSILLVLTRRPGPAPWPEHEAWLEGVGRLALGPLGREAARGLLQAHTEGDAGADPATLSRLLDEAAGNAFLLEFLARHAGAGREGTLDLETALRRTLDALTPDARLLFECVVLTPQPLPLASLGPVVADRSRLRDQAAALTSNRLVSVDEHDRVRPYHDALRERADAMLGAAERPARHGRIVEALRAQGAPAEWQIPHLEGAGRTQEAGEACLAAGDGASRTHAFEIAVQYFQKALALARLASPVRAATLEKLSDNLSLMGRGREAALRYEEAAGLMTGAAEPRTVLAVEHKRALALLRTGALDEGRAVLRSVLRGVGERLPEGNASAVGMFVVERLRRGIDRRLSGPRAHPSLDDAGRLRLDVLWTAGTSLAMYAPVPANALLTRLLTQALRVDDPRRMTRALAMELVMVSALGGRWRAEANALEQDLRERFGSIPWEYERAWVAACVGAATWVAGDLRACVEWTTRARRLFRQVPEMSAFEFAVLDAWRLPAMAMVGDFDEAVRTADDLLEVAMSRDDQFASLVCLHGYITLAYVATGKADLARERVRLGLARAEQLDSPLPAFLQLWSRATLALHAGEGRLAYETVRGDWSRLGRSGAFVFESCVGDSRDLRARAALAAARTAPPRRRAALLADARAHSRWLDRCTLRLAPYLSASIDAQVAAIEGRDSAAETRARAAIEGFDALGLRPNGDALRRWLSGEPAKEADSVYVAR
ncbi:MAG: AAA family ATPase, partial [Polyangiaceae bacterium]